MPSLSGDTVVNIPMNKVVGVVALIVSIAGLWWTMKSNIEKNEEKLILIEKNVQINSSTLLEHDDRLDESDIDRVEIRSQLANIQELLLEIKSKIQ